MLVELVVAVAVLAGLFYRWITKSFDKWQRDGLPHDKPTFPFGTHPFILGKKHINDFAYDDYKKFKLDQKQQVHGWFLFGKPALSINNVELLKQLMVKDFNHFVDRNEYHLSKTLNSDGAKLDKLWGLQLANSAGDQWKDIRSTFTPIFTSGKMKSMLFFIKETTKGLVMELGDKANAGEEFELKGTFGKFSMDALATCAFGVNAQSFSNEKSVFVKHAASVFTLGPIDNILTFAKLIPGFARLLGLLNINTFKPKATKYLSDVILHALRARKESGARRNDMIDLMLDAIKDGDNLDENDNSEDVSQYDKDMKFDHKKQSKVTEEEIVATALVFLVAGYDTTGMTLSFLAYQMSKHPELQQRLHQEIDDAYEAADGAMPDYATIQALPYLDQLVHETLRLHSPVGLNTRSCTKDYRLPGTDITVRERDLLTWSVTGIHRDPEHYSHPEEFYPDHFSKEQKAARHPYAFQAFGQGPRACIGMRFALLEAKTAILSVWRQFSFQPGGRTLEPLQLDPESQLGWVKGGLWARAVARDL